MKNKNTNLGFTLFWVLIFVCSLSFSPVKTCVEVDDEQEDINIRTLSTPKSSGYAVNELWNDPLNDVTRVAVSADGKYMVVGIVVSGGDELYFYNTSDHNGIEMWSFDTGGTISSLAISADGEYIVAGSRDAGRAWLLNSTLPEAGNPKKEVWYVDWGDAVNTVDISADGELIVVGGDNGGMGKIYLYDNSPPPGGWGADKTLDELWYYAPSNNVNCVAISADGKYIGAGTDDTNPGSEIFLFNTTDYTLGSVQPPMWNITTFINFSSVALSADGEYIIMASEENQVACLFNKTIPAPFTSKIYIWFVDYSPNNPINSVDISADGKYIVLGTSGVTGSDGLLVVYNNSRPILDPYKKNNEFLWYGVTTGNVSSVSITADGKYIVAGTTHYPDFGPKDSDTVLLYNNSDYIYKSFRKAEWSFNTTNDVNSVSISAWGNHFAAGGLSSSGIAYLFYHARPPHPLWPRSDDDDDDDEAEAIPFGNYYLLFALIGIVTLIIIHKRKIFVSKK